MQISISGEMEQFIRAKVSSGQFASDDEVVAGALELLKETERLSDQDIETLRAEIQKGVDELNRGEGAVWNAGETKVRVMQRLGQRRKVD